MCEVSAYHEAGHAVAAWTLGARLGRATIAPDWDDGPDRFAEIEVRWPRGDFSDRELCERIATTALAGPIAETIHRGETFEIALAWFGSSPEWTADWAIAWNAVASLFPDESRRIAYLQQAAEQLFAMLNRDDMWAALAAIVDHLVAHETVEGEEIEEILQQWLA
ncbi:MAG: hypothetical protein KDA61_15610 [Planctomycetales bacterium]|nr:hypothetical protein [Planctomycetales bacterium]